MHSDFQSYILLCEVLTAKPKGLLYLTYRTCSMHSVFLMHDHPPLLELVGTKEDVQAALLLFPLWPSPSAPEPWPKCVSDILSGSEQATPIQCQSKMFQFQELCECWLHIHFNEKGYWHLLLVLLSLKWSAQLLDLVPMRRLHFSLHVEALYTWRLINVLDWCHIHNLNLNQVCFSEIKQLVGIIWNGVSELRGNGMAVHEILAGSLVWGSRSMKNENNIQKIAAVLALDIFSVQATIQIKCCNFSEYAHPVSQMQVATSQVDTDYWHGFPLTKDAAYRVSFYIREQVSWDPGGIMQQRLGDKPCFKEGRMSAVSWAVMWAASNENGHGPIQAKQAGGHHVQKGQAHHRNGSSIDQKNEPASCGSRLAVARVIFSPSSSSSHPPILIPGTF